nr:transposase [Flavobacterium sp. 140616W15]
MTVNYQSILNYFDNRSTNASAESFNAKVKAFRGQFRGVRKVDFLLLRLSNLQVFRLIRSIHSFFSSVLTIKKNSN